MMSLPSCEALTRSLEGETKANPSASQPHSHEHAATENSTSETSNMGFDVTFA